MDENHDERLYEKSRIELRAWIVEYAAPSRTSLADGDKEWEGAPVPGESAPKHRCDQHDQGYIQRETSTRPRPVHRQCLIAIREKRRQYQEQRGDVAREREEPSHLVPGLPRGVARSWWLKATLNLLYGAQDALKEMREIGCKQVGDIARRGHPSATREVEGASGHGARWRWVRAVCLVAVETVRETNTPFRAVPACCQRSEASELLAGLTNGLGNCESSIFCSVEKPGRTANSKGENMAISRQKPHLPPVGRAGSRAEAVCEGHRWLGKASRNLWLGARLSVLFATRWIAAAHQGDRHVPSQCCEGPETPVSPW